MSSNPPASAACGASLYPNGIRCARAAGHDGKHNNVGEIVQWDDPMCWAPVTVNGKAHVCIRPIGHEGGHGE